MNTTRLINLSPGDKFEIPSCSQSLRRGEVIRNSDSSTYVSIQENKSDSWKQENLYLSGSTNVICVEEFEQKEIIEKTVDAPPKIKQNKDVGSPIKYKKNMNTENENQSVVKRGRGRAAGPVKNYVVPSTPEFTKNDLLAANPTMKVSDAGNYIAKMIKNNVFVVAGTVEKEVKTKGRRQAKYRLV